MMFRSVALFLCGLTAATATASTVPMMQDRDLVEPVVGGLFPSKNKADIMESAAAAAAVSLDENTGGDDAAPMKKSKKSKLLKTLTLFPAPTPNFLAAFIAGLLWLMIFCTGFCALFAVETPVKFVEKGLMMNKEN